jgi:hypothetical protein
VIIVRNGKAQLSVAGQAKSQPSFGNVEAALPLVAGDEEAVFDLEAACRDHDAGFGDCRPISRDRRIAIRLALAAKENGSGQNNDDQAGARDACKQGRNPVLGSVPQRLRDRAERQDRQEAQRSHQQYRSEDQGREHGGVARQRPDSGRPASLGRESPGQGQC